MNYFEAKSNETIKDSELYNFINPAESRKIGTTPFKKNIENIIKTEKIPKAEIVKNIKNIESGTKSFGVKVQKHISLPAAVYLYKNKKSITKDILETCVKAQKDYFYKSFPKKESDIDVVSKKLIQQLGNNKDITAKQIAFAAYYRWGINKILSSNSIDSFSKEFPEVIQKELDELTSEQKDKYLSRLKSSLRPYSDSEIINKAMREFNTAGEKTNINKSTLEEIKDIALTAIIDDEIINREIQKGTSSLTRLTMGSRKEIKKAEQVKQIKKSAKEDSSITKDDLERMLKSIPGYSALQKTKKERIQDVISNVSKKRDEAVNDLIDLQRKRSEIISDKSPTWKEQVSKTDKQIKELSKKIGASSSAELWSNLRSNINKVVGNLLDEKPKEQIVKSVKKSMSKMSDNSMDFMKDLMGDSFIPKNKKNSYFLNEEEEIDDDDMFSFYSFLSDIRRARLPKFIVEPYMAPERHRQNCERCQGELFDLWKKNSLSLDSRKDLKSEMIRQYYSDVSKKIFNTQKPVDDSYLAPFSYYVFKKGQELKNFENEGDAREYMRSLVDAHISEKPGIPPSIIRSQYSIEKRS